MKIVLKSSSNGFEHAYGVAESLLIATDQCANTLLMRCPNLFVTLRAFRRECEQYHAPILWSWAALDQASGFQAIRYRSDVALVGEQHATEIDH